VAIVKIVQWFAFISKNDFTPGVLKLLEPEITFLKSKLMQDRLLVTFTKMVHTLDEIKFGTRYTRAL
jgi:hypothetical protein